MEFCGVGRIPPSGFDKKPRRRARCAHLVGRRLQPAPIPDQFINLAYLLVSHLIGPQFQRYNSALRPSPICA
jgi:hypothetical protein